MAGGGRGTFPWPWLEMAQGPSGHRGLQLPWPRAPASSGSPGSQAVAVALPSHASRGDVACGGQSPGSRGRGQGRLGKHPLNHINIS